MLPFLDMNFCSVVAWASVLTATLAAPPSPALLNDIHQPNQGGSQKIVGTSFGIPGQDADFDYVVRHCPTELPIKS